MEERRKVILLSVERDPIGVMARYVRQIVNERDVVLHEMPQRAHFPFSDLVGKLFEAIELVMNDLDQDMWRLEDEDDDAD